MLTEYKKGNKMKRKKEVKDIFAYHQIKIAKSTLKMSDIGARIMGGMTKDEARDILKKHEIKFQE